jgi:GMP synthase (glutamine-hydrolysing)
MKHSFVIIDFGSQVTQLIARRLRELGFYSEILHHQTSVDEIIKRNPAGIILSGGPNSVYEPNAPKIDIKPLLKISPVMGICYGMQLLAHQLGGKVESSAHREYGHSKVRWTDLFSEQKVWMSHGDIVTTAPEGCKIIARSDNNLAAAFLGENILAVQFHPEVKHTERGDEILKHFCTNMCKAQSDWNAPHILEILKKEIPQKVGSEHVIVGLSGGVDSTVTAVLLTKILGKDQVFCVFVNNGLLRENEYEQVLHQYQDLGLNVKGVDASTDFLTALKNVQDPEQKRKIIGRVFIETFEKQITPQIKWLAQGTLYPDVIESVSAFGGPSQTIKSHHNVGGLPQNMKLQLLEPFRDLFKDEVRKLGKELGLSAALIYRHPFPGPGLAIRVLGAVDEIIHP